MIDTAVQNLIQYAIQKKLIAPEDELVIRNQLLDVLHRNSWEDSTAPDISDTDSIDDILAPLVAYACETGIIPDTNASRDLFDTKLMGILTALPHEVNAVFRKHYSESPESATQWYYAYNQALNYVRAGRIARDLKWTYDSPYGTLDITINRSKPEKDPRDIAAAGKRGIPVAVTAGMNATPVSEMALALMLAVYRNVVPMTLDAMDGTWSRESYAKRSYTVSGKTVGIYGIGNIGRKVAALVKAFSAEVIYYDPFRLPENQEAELGVTFVDPDTLLRKSDILSLHAPLTEQTRNFICAETLAKMKDGAVLINTAREELVDYAAAAQALRSGKLLGAGFDAIEEDLVRSNPFVGLKNVVLTQHLGGNTTDNAVQMARRIAQQITAVRDGKKLEKPHLVNGDYLQE